MGNFTDLIPILCIVVVVYSLGLTLAGLIVAKVFNKPTQEPWSMTKMENGIWLLKRQAPTQAIIHGMLLERTDEPQPEEEQTATPPSVINPPAEHSKVFMPGSTLMLRINASHSKIFTLYYEEHATQLDQFGSVSRIQSWRTKLR